VTLALIASDVFAGGTKCPTSLNLGTQTISCSGQQCIGDPGGTCVAYTFHGFPRDVTVYNVLWVNGKATLTPWLSYPSPGPLNSTMETCACKKVNEEEQYTSYGDDWCCDAVYVEVPGEPRRPGTVGTCQEDGCTNPNPNCTLEVEANGHTAEAVCNP
jgi:hypothetical protein